MGVLPFGQTGDSSSFDTALQGVPKIVTCLNKVLEDIETAYGAINLRVEQFDLQIIKEKVLNQPFDLHPEQATRDIMEGMTNMFSKDHIETRASFIELSIETIDRVIYVVDANISILDTHINEFYVKFPELVDSYTKNIMELKSLSVNIQDLKGKVVQAQALEGLQDVMRNLENSSKNMREIISSLDPNFKTDPFDIEVFKDKAADKLDKG